MQGGGVLLATLAAVLLCATVRCSAAVGGSHGSGTTEGGLTRPLRPAVFHTPEELRHYLDAVSNYYAVASRPSRYGKRSSQHLSRGALRRESVLDSLANAEQAMEAESVDAVPDYLFQFAPGPAPSPASDVYPLFLDQERLERLQSRGNQD
ncbi:uncharacterized protein LOC117654062 [Thrips palmi]|uniref:Uncharacterized protein LOC117654062 n=1 Tax=Thrips palmi TaxID=161013 RepID=A0A6P9ACZ7_THRPL|nr:uncharacterized protein LOC117654062 [Thrips palmi]